MSGLPAATERALTQARAPLNVWIAAIRSGEGGIDREEASVATGCALRGLMLP